MINTNSKIIKAILLSVFISFIIFLIGIILSYWATYLLPGDPITAYLGTHFTQSQYLALYKKLGFNNLLIIQIFNYIIRIFTGNWGPSTFVPNGTVMGLISTVLPSMLLRIGIPLIISIVLGFFLAKYLKKTKKTNKKHVFIILLVFFLSASWLFIVLLAVGIPVIPIIGKDFIGTLILILIFTPIIMKLIYSKTKEKTLIQKVISNTLYTFLGSGLIISWFLIVNTTFISKSYGDYLFASILYNDLFTACGLILLLVILQAVVVLISNLILIYLNQANEINSENSEKTSNFHSNDSNEKDIIDNELKPESTPKKIKFYLLKSPILLIGLIFLIGMVILMAIAPLLTPYSRTDIIYKVFPSPWSSPSIAHPFGTIYLGKDLFAIFLYSIQDSFLYGLIGLGMTLAIGLGFGLLIQLIGLKSEKGKKISKVIIMYLFFLFYAIPFLIISTLSLLNTSPSLTYRIFLSQCLIALFFAPLFIHYTSKPKIERGNIREVLKKKIGKTVIILIPLVFAGSLILNYFLGFFGINSSDFFNLASFLNLGYYWTSFFPALGIFLVLFPLFLIHEGLLNYPFKTKERD